MNNVVYCDIELGRLIQPIFLFPENGSVGVSPNLIGQAPVEILEDTLITMCKTHDSHKIYLQGLRDYNAHIKENIEQKLINKYSDYNITVTLL